MAELWVLSANKPYHTMITLGILLVILAFINGLLRWVFGWIFPPFFVLIYTWMSWFWIALGVYFLFLTGFVYYDSRSIYRDPFPEGSVCSCQSERQAYDWCAICGRLACPDELTRIQQSFTSSFGMFGFDGVACQECAQRRVKRYAIVSIAVIVVFFPLVLIPLWTVLQIFPWNLAMIVGIVLVIIFSITAPLGVRNWQRLFQKVRTPLAQHPELMIPIKERLAEKGMVGKEAVFRKISK
jgi:hypothetical protein